MWDACLSRLWWVVLCALFVSACQEAGGPAAPLGAATQTSQAPQEGVVGVWSTAPYGPYPLGPLTLVDNQPLPGSPQLATFPNDEAVNRSFRMIVKVTQGGQQIRVRLSNLMGKKPVTFSHVHVAPATLGLPAIDGKRRVAIRFNQQNTGTAQPGEELISDFVPFEFKAGEQLAIGFHVEGNSGPITWHAVSFAPQYVSAHNSGPVAQDATGLSFNQIATGWFFVSGLDAINPKSVGGLVALGDSITDGFFQLQDQRWTDFLAQRFQQTGTEVGILNQGINSNTVTTARNGAAGPAALLRFDRDVLDRSGVKGLLLFEGTNDLGSGVKAPELIEAYKTLIAKARAKGLCVFMGTIPPRMDVAFGWFPDGPTVKEPERLKVNQWIRTQAPIDGVLDFESALALPGVSNLPNPLLYIPDLLHPNALGFKAMADVIDIKALITKCRLN